MASCKANGEGDDVTFAITDLSKLDALILAFDKVAEQLYNSSQTTAIARAAVNADNFGGNNRSEGYTNMIDLADFLRNASSYADTSAALKALDACIVASTNGAQHRNAGGLSMYYPLSIQGNTELKTFREIATSTYYLALVDKLAYGSTGGNMSSYDNSYLVDDSDDTEYDPDYDTGSGESVLSISDVFLDEDGVYTVYLDDTDALAYGSCAIYMILEDDDEYYYIYLGEDDDVLIDWDEGIVTDNFDGSWVYFGDDLAPIELVGQYDDVSLYIIDILLNGEETYLLLEYDWDSGEFNVRGTVDAIDSETGMAARPTGLIKGDQIELIYWYQDDNGDWDYFTSDPISYSSKMDIGYYELGEGEYYYGIYLYDIYGNYLDTGMTIFGVEADGSLYFYEE